MYYIIPSNYYRDDLDDREVMVTIRCITYNHEKYIADALEGFVMQKTNFRFEAIVHDDASTDGTAAIIREYAEKYPSIIKPIFETENQYSKKDGSLRRIMNDHVRGKYVAYCEGDDYWTDPLKLQKQVDALEAHPECTIALNRVQTVDRDNRKLDWTIPPKKDFTDGVISIDNLIEKEFNQGKWTFHTSSFFCRAELPTKTAELKKSVLKNFPYGDMPLLLTCLLNGKGYFYSDIMGSYRVMSGGYNSSLAADPEKAVKDFLLVAEALSDLNKFTGYKYNKSLRRGINRYRIRAEFRANPGFSYKWLAPQYYGYYRTIFYRFATTKVPILYTLYKKINTICVSPLKYLKNAKKR